MHNQLTYTKEIPKEVKVLFDDEYKIDHIGQYKGAEAYRAYIPNEKTGFPSLCLVRPKGVSVVDGFDAIDIINKIISKEK